MLIHPSGGRIPHECDIQLGTTTARTHASGTRFTTNPRDADHYGVHCSQEDEGNRFVLAIWEQSRWAVCSSSVSGHSHLRGNWILRSIGAIMQNYNEIWNR